MSTKKLFIIFAFLNGSTMVCTPIADANGVSYDSPQSSQPYYTMFPGAHFIPSVITKQIAPNDIASASSSSSATVTTSNVSIPSATSVNMPATVLKFICKKRAQSFSEESAKIVPADATPVVALRRAQSLVNQLCLIQE